MIIQSDTNYYKRLLMLALPIVVQQLISVSLNLVDNIMIGKLGPLPLAAVGSANQVVGIYSMILFGLFSGAAVPLAQYFGVKDFKSIRGIVGMDVILCLALGIPTVIMVMAAAPEIITFFADDAEVISLGSQYMRITAPTYLTTGISYAIAFNSRSVQSLKVPTTINICSILTNTILNYMLIYGHGGFSAMGVKGAAVATLIARVFEMAALITYLCVDKNHPFHGRIKDFTNFTVDFVKSVMKTALPVVISEGGWSLGVTLTFAAYGKISAQALAVVQVSQVLCSLCQCSSFGVGNANAALTGATLGQRKGEEAYENSKKYMKVQWGLNGLMCVMILILRRPIAAIYDFDADTTQMLMLSLGVFAFTLIPRMASYAVQCGILRAGGDTFFCMVVELACNLGIEVALAYMSVLLFNLPLHLCIAVASGGNLIKAIIEYRRYLSKKWINTII